MTPEQEAEYALGFGVARRDLPEAAQLAYDRLVEQQARARPRAPISPVGAQAGEEGRQSASSARFSVAELRTAIAVDVIVLAAAVGVYLVIAVTNIVSWPANRMLISAGSGGVLFFAVWLLAAYALVSNALLYGWPPWMKPGRAPRPGELLGAMFWGSRQRPSWAKLPTSMRRPPWWMWLLLVPAAVGGAAVVAGSFAAGVGKIDLRVLPGPRYEVSAPGLHDGAWTQVPHATYQAYAAGLMRQGCIVMPFVCVLIANTGYALFLRRELLRSGLADSPSPAS